MSFRSILIGTLALTCGVSAVFLLQNFMQNARPEAAAAPPDVVQVAVAAVDIPRSHTISSELVKIVDWPKDRLPAGALTKVEEVCDRVAMSPFVKNEPLLDGKLTA